MPKRPENITPAAWRVMQCLRNGDTIAENHQTGSIYIIGVCRISFDAFEELKAMGFVRVVKERGRYTTYRLSDVGWDVAAGDVMRPMTRAEAEREVEKHGDSPPMPESDVEAVMEYVLSGGTRGGLRPTPTSPLRRERGERK